MLSTEPDARWALSGVELDADISNRRQCPVSSVALSHSRPLQIQSQ